MCSSPGLSACPSRWLTATEGLFPKAAIDFPTLRPTVRQTIKPGPAVAAIPSSSLISDLLSVKAFLIIKSMFSIWALAASSGTTPPNFSCSLIWLETTLDKISAEPSSFSWITAAAVSSQLVSIPKNLIFFFHYFLNS